jgi:hypothetical protein
MITNTNASSNRKRVWQFHDYSPVQKKRRVTNFHSKFEILEQIRLADHVIVPKHPDIENLDYMFCKLRRTQHKNLVWLCHDRPHFQTTNH